MAPSELQHLTLIVRDTAIGETNEFGVAVETSLYRSNVTGLYMIEQVFNETGKPEERKWVSISKSMAKKMIGPLQEYAA